MQQVKGPLIEIYCNDCGYQYSPSLSAHLFVSLMPDKPVTASVDSLDPRCLLPNIYANALVCKFLSTSPPVLQLLPSHSFLTISHFPTSAPRLYLTSITPSLSRRGWQWGQPGGSLMGWRANIWWLAQIKVLLWNHTNTHAHTHARRCHLAAGGQLAARGKGK